MNREWLLLDKFWKTPIRFLEIIYKRVSNFFFETRFDLLSAVFKPSDADKQSILVEKTPTSKYIIFKYDWQLFQRYNG